MLLKSWNYCIEPVSYLVGGKNKIPLRPLLSRSIFCLIYFDLRAPLSVSNLPQSCSLPAADATRPPPPLLHPHPNFLLSLQPRSTFFSLSLPLLYYHSPSVRRSDPFSLRLFRREMMERSDPGDFLVNQWVITCITVSASRWQIAGYR